MHLCCRFLILPAALILLGGNVLAGKKDDGGKSSKDGSKKPSTSSKGTDKDDKNAQEDKQIQLPLVEKQPSFGLKIPYRVQGKLQMMFTIGTALKVDKDHVQMGDLMVETYDDDGEVEMNIDLPASVLDLNSRVLTTKTPGTIKRDDFELSGDNIEFNTETKKGKLVGNVRMLIYDLNEAANVSTDDSKTAREGK